MSECPKVHFVALRFIWLKFSDLGFQTELCVTLHSINRTANLGKTYVIENVLNSNISSTKLNKIAVYVNVIWHNNLYKHRAVKAYTICNFRINKIIMRKTDF